MAIGGISSGPDLSQLNAEMAQLTTDYSKTQIALMQPDGTYTQDQISSFARSAVAIRMKIFDLAAEIRVVVLAAQPVLTAPRPLSAADTGTNNAEMRANGWLTPSALTAYISMMMYVLHQEALYGAMEGRNIAKAMTAQEELGTAEAAKQKEQGRLELTKAWVTASIEIFSAAVQMATVVKRTTVMAKGGGSAKTQKMQEEADTKTAENTRQINLKQTENAKLEAELRGDTSAQGVAIGSAPVGGRKALDPKSDRAKEINKQMAKNDEEIGELKSRNTKIQENLDYQKQEMLRQELVTWEQVGRAIDHFSSAATKLSEGFFTKQIKYLDADITMIRTHLDILRTYTQSATKGESEGRQAAQEAAKAMDNYFQAHTQAYWAKAA